MAKIKKSKFKKHNKMTTKIKIKPIIIGSLAGAGIGFVASKMMGKKRMPFVIGGAVLGAIACYSMCKKREEKSSNASGTSAKPKLMLPANKALAEGLEFCDDNGNSTTYNYYTDSNGTHPSRICKKNRQR